MGGDGEDDGSSGAPSLNRRVAVSSVATMATNLAGIATGLVTFRFLTTRLGTSAYGQLATITNLVSVFVILTDIGVIALTTRELAQQPEEAASILGRGLGFRLSLCAIGMPIVWITGFALYSQQASIIRLGIVILSLSLPLEGASALLLSHFRASIRGVTVALWALTKGTITAVVLIVVLVSGGGVLGCVLCYLGGAVLSTLLAVILVRREVTFRPQFKGQSWRRTGMTSLAFGSIQIVNLLYLKFDILLLSVLSSSRVVGLYAVAYTLIEIVSNVPSAFMATVFPVLSRVTEGEASELAERASASLSALAGLAVAGVVVLGPALITLVSGPNYSGARIPLYLLSVTFLFTFPALALGTTLVAINKMYGILRISIFGLLLNAGLNLVLIPTHGAPGAAGATVVSELVVFVASARNFQRTTGRRIPIFTQSARPTLAAAACIGLSLLAPQVSAPIIAVLVIKSLVIAIAYVVLLWAMGGLPQEAKAAVRSVTRRFAR